jgi:hypothetical protein
MGDEGAVKDILLGEYRFMQKSYELQFTHFMGVFYIWIPVVTIPVGAGILANLGSKPLAFGFLICFVAIIGVFLSAKMFDIRRSQIRYLERTNRLREALWEKYKIEDETGISPLGKGVDLVKIATTDFGLMMAVTMSAVHGTLGGVGVARIMSASPYFRCAIPSGIVFGLILSVTNILAFFWIVGHRSRVR